jgi:hypothetical protein
LKPLSHETCEIFAKFWRGERQALPDRFPAEARVLTAYKNLWHTFC